MDSFSESKIWVKSNYILTFGQKFIIIKLKFDGIKKSRRLGDDEKNWRANQRR